MSSIVAYVLLLLLNLGGMSLLMMTSKRHRAKFLPKLQCILPFGSLALRNMGLCLCLLAFVLTYFTSHTGYFVVVWFGSLSLAAGIVYLYMVLYELSGVK
ncbi:DUF3325 family protein [Psychrobacter pygoscelis]|uniref:DUF3325 family protein n=1 Tax=Psychrobacter pygoscelis TaxID=2488563 RepID=UPI00103993E0|nr:DUF3325 family protein [Psychrobacter pygoscelis]